MKTKYTSGKWVICQQTERTLTVNLIGEHGKQIADCLSNDFRNSNGKPTEEAIANAKLIAHAPELLQMVYDLKKCIERLTEQENPDKTLEAYWIGEAHELLHNINPDYYKNANE